MIKSEVNNVIVNTYNLIKTKIHKNSHKVRGSLYVIEDTSRGIIKIGMSTEPQRRVKGQISLFNLGKNCRYFIGDYIENLLVVEKALHKTLSKHKSYCEWYNLSFETGVRLVKEISKLYTTITTLDEKEEELEFNRIKMLILKPYLELDFSEVSISVKTVNIILYFIEKQYNLSSINTNNDLDTVMCELIQFLHTADESEVSLLISLFGDFESTLKTVTDDFYKVMKVYKHFNEETFPIPSHVQINEKGQCVSYIM